MLGLALGFTAVAFSIAGAKILQKMWEGVRPCLDPWDVVRLRASSSYWNDPGKYGPHSELFFFFVRKEPVALTHAVPFCGNAHGAYADRFAPSAAEDEAGSSGSQVPDLGDMWRSGCPKSQDWDSDGESWSESEFLSSSDH